MNQSEKSDDKTILHQGNVGNSGNDAQDKTIIQSTQGPQSLSTDGKGAENAVNAGNAPSGKDEKATNTSFAAKAGKVAGSAAIAGVAGAAAGIGTVYAGSSDTHYGEALSDEAIQGADGDKGLEQAMAEDIPSEKVYEVNHIQHTDQAGADEMQAQSVDLDEMQVVEDGIYGAENGADVYGCGMIYDTEQMMDYVIQPGDTLSEIAQSYSTSVDHIMALNPEITNPDLIYAGDNLVIPLGDNESNPYADWSPSPEDSILVQPTFENGGEEPVYDVELDSTDQEFSDVQTAEVDWVQFEEDIPMNEPSVSEDIQLAEGYESDLVYEDQSQSFSGEEYIESNDVMLSEYDSEFQQTDFASYDIPDHSFTDDFSAGQQCTF